MWEWWNSLESVTKFRWWVGFFGITSALLVPIFGGLRWWSDNRRDYLRQELEKPRQLSPQQQEQFFDIVKEAPRRILIQSPSGDSEALALASELAGLLGNAGWEVEGRLGEGVFNPPIYGIKIELNRVAENEKKYREIAKTEISVLEHALKVAGIPRTQLTFPIGLDMVPYKGIKLYIGHKPKPSD